MNRTNLAFACAVTAFIAAGAAHAQTSDKEAAVALVEKAIAYVQKNGVEAACKEFSDPNGGFKQGDLYVFVQGMDVTMICNAANHRLDGKNLSALKDTDGKMFAKAMVDLAKSKGAGWVDYRWVNPTTKEIEPKSSYIQRVDDKLLLGVGIYRK